MSLRYVLIALTLMISVAGFTSFHTAAKRDAEKSAARAMATTRRYSETHIPTYRELFPTPTGQNAYEDYALCRNDLTAQDAFRYAEAVETLRLNEQMKPQQRLSVPDWAQGKTIPQLEREATAQYGHEFALIEQGNAKPCQLPATMGVGGEKYNPGAYLSDFKRMCKLMNVTIDLRLTGTGSEKDSKQATRLLVDEMRFGRNFSHIDLMHYLVGVACESMAYNQIEDNLDRFSSDDWSALESEARKELSQGTPAKQALASQIPEEVRVIGDFASSTAGPDPNQAGPIDVDVDDQPNEQLWKDMHAMSSEERNLALTKADGYLIREYTVDQHALDKPMSQWPWPGDPQTVSQDPIVRELTQGTLNVADLNKIAAQAEIRLRLVVVHALIQKYRIRTGHLPATLNDLDAPTSDFKDPLSGGDFEYQPSGASYRLYSPGKGLMYPIELTLKPQLYPDIRAKLQAQAQTQTQP